jgi:hypothetical protein
MDLRICLWPRHQCGVTVGRRMFFRIKPSGERRYLKIVENTRDGAATRQRVVATLGRVEDLEAAGKRGGPASSDIVSASISGSSRRFLS